MNIIFYMYTEYYITNFLFIRPSVRRQKRGKNYHFSHILEGRAPIKKITLGLYSFYLNYFFWFQLELLDLNTTR